MGGHRPLAAGRVVTDNNRRASVVNRERRWPRGLRSSVGFDGFLRRMTTKPFEPSPEDPGLRPDTHPDGSPVTSPGLELEAPEISPEDPTEPQPTES